MQFISGQSFAKWFTSLEIDESLLVLNCLKSGLDSYDLIVVLRHLNLLFPI